jgi:hypothetical protein
VINPVAVLQAALADRYTIERESGRGGSKRFLREIEIAGRVESECRPRWRGGVASVLRWQIRSRMRRELLS